MAGWQEVKDDKRSGDLKIGWSGDLIIGRSGDTALYGAGYVTRKRYDY